MPQPFASTEKFEFLADLVGGMDSGQAPEYLENNTAAFILNGTVRAAYLHNRPAYRNIRLTFPDDATRLAFTGGLFQEAQFYKPDNNGTEYLLTAISGRLYKILPDALGNATVTDVTGGFPQSPTAPQNWMWQAEEFMIWNDGINLPVFYDGTITRRSLGQSGPLAIQTTKVTPPVAPGLFTMDVSTTANLVIGMTLLIGPGGGRLIVNNILGPTQITAQNVTMDPTLFYLNNKLFNADTFGSPAELPVGRMGVYGMGRVWMSLANGKDFIAGDIVDGPSGTLPYNFRDSVLKVTENDFLVGGGIFTIPGSTGDIRAMIFVAQLDQMLGQGPLLVYTPTTVFSVNSPVDRLTWQTLTNPILTESLAAGGGLSQWSTVNANSDTISRDLVGIRSLIMARRDFQSHGNTPISREVERVINQDNQSLLAFSSAVVFDNRLLMTTRPIQGTHGVYHLGLIALNFDPVSTLRGKLPEVYDGAWTGLNTFKLVTGVFSSISRTYVFNFNSGTNEIELWEIMQSAEKILIADNGTTPITFEFESAQLFDSDERKPSERQLKRLINGEFYIEDLIGTIQYQVFYKPEAWPCWVPWFQGSECADMTVVNSQPQFRPRIGLGEPSGIPCDQTNNRPLREGFNFQVRFVITGHCRFMGARFMAVTVPIPKFAPPRC